MHVLPFMVVFWIVRAIYRWTRRRSVDGRTSPVTVGLPPRPPLGDYRG
ncbi:hypothetical protein [Sphingomonas panacis]|nr:hypothetical protein [Sphingomonas panacis]